MSSQTDAGTDAGTETEARAATDGDGSGRHAWWPVTALVVGLLIAAALLAGVFEPEPSSSMTEG